MTRRALFAAIVAAIPRAARADDDGARRMARDNRRCARWARARLRHGLTARERAALERHGCKDDPVLGWVSARIYTAEDE